MPNIEIKAKMDSEKARATVISSGGQFLGEDHQVDTYFHVQKGRLKLRESSLSGAQLVPYVRPDTLGPKKSDYILMPVPDSVVCKRLFTDLLGVDVIVEKWREIYLIGNVRIHIDDVVGLGQFFEFEAIYEDPMSEVAEYQKVRGLMETFEIQENDLLERSYREMIKERYEK